MIFDLNFYDEFISWSIEKDDQSNIKVPENIYHPSLLNISLKLFKQKLIIFTRKNLEEK